ncbi:MAG: DUF4384 domain-containing protein [Candidatus Tectomicrobia bacterium]|nr:DUF4384 domain-containing protein [Candidatus Tectomicrobia bacterium]
MRRYSCRFGVFVLGLLAALTLTVLTAEADQVRAKIGIRIQSGAQVMRAKAHDRVRTGDQLRLYIVPETPTYTYVIHTDHEKVRLLHRERYVPDFKAHQPIRFPPERQQEYAIDGRSRLEEFIVICSPIELVYITNLFESPQASYERWKLIEDKLVERSRIKLSETPDKPFAIAGNVRGPDETFVQQLQIFSGQEFLVKKYEFRVKK